MMIIKTLRWCKNSLLFSWKDSDLFLVLPNSVFQSVENLKMQRCSNGKIIVSNPFSNFIFVFLNWYSFLVVVLMFFFGRFLFLKMLINVTHVKEQIIFLSMIFLFMLLIFYATPERNVCLNLICFSMFFIHSNFLSKKNLSF